MHKGLSVTLQHKSKSYIDTEMTESTNRPLRFSPFAQFSGHQQSPVPDQLDLMKVATASYDLFTTLYAQLQKRNHFQLSPIRSPNRVSVFARFQKGGEFPFRKGGKVKLADGSVQKIEQLEFDDFLRAAAAAGTENLLQWVEVESIQQETGSGRGMVKIQFVLNRFSNSLFSVPTPIKFEYMCPKEQPFFVLSRGWSSCNPQATQNRFGLSCLPLSIRDACLVTVPPEIAKSYVPLSPIQTSENKRDVNVPLLSERAKQLYLAFLSQVNACSPYCNGDDSQEQQIPQPIDLKKEKRELPQGSVPEYFSAASLAESPYNEPKS